MGKCVAIFSEPNRKRTNIVAKENLRDGNAGGEVAGEVWGNVLADIGSAGRGRGGLEDFVIGGSFSLCPTPGLTVAKVARGSGESLGIFVPGVWPIRSPGSRQKVEPTAEIIYV